MTEETKKGRTPNGGDYSKIFYFDKDGNSVDKKKASFCRILEFKNDGTIVGELHATVKKPAQRAK